MEVRLPLLQLERTLARGSRAVVHVPCVGCTYAIGARRHSRHILKLTNRTGGASPVATEALDRKTKQS